MEKTYQHKILKSIDKSLKSFKEEFLNANPELLTADIKDIFTRWKPQIDDELTENIYEMLLKSWLLGMKHTNRDKNAEFEDSSINFNFALSYEEAIKFADSRVTLTKEQFNKLSNKMKVHAFTLARLSQLDNIERVKETYIKQMKNEQSNIQDFVKQASTISGGNEAYYETVFRTNMQKDYNAGKAMEMMNNPPPFLQFIGIDDERQSEICEARTGVVLPYSDPWWDNNWPPLHFNCRSTIREIGEAEALRLGLYEKKQYSLPKNPRNRATSSFGANPAKDNAFWTATPSQTERIINDKIQEEINGTVGQTICADFKTEKAGFTNVATSKGGVRYPQNMLKDTELENNLTAAKILAEDEGYYVELRKSISNRNNKDFDIWLNGMDKAEIKTFETIRANTMIKSIVNASEQSDTIILLIKEEKQKSALIHALLKAKTEITKTKKRTIKLVKVITPTKIFNLPRFTDMKDTDITKNLTD